MINTLLRSVLQLTDEAVLKFRLKPKVRTGRLLAMIHFLGKQYPLQFKIEDLLPLLDSKV